MKTIDQRMTVREAASKLGLTRAGVYNLIYENMLPSIRVSAKSGSRLFISYKALQEYLKSRSTGAKIPKGDIAVWSNTNKLLTVKDVRCALGLSESGVYKYVNLGQIPAIRVGSRIRFSADAIARYLEIGRTEKSNVKTDKEAVGI